MNPRSLVTAFAGLAASVTFIPIAFPIAAADASPCSDASCSSAPVEFNYSDSLFDPIAYQSEWFPKDWRVQMRISVRVMGQTEIDMGGEMVARGAAPMDVGAVGGKSAGRLAFGYGLEVVPELRIDVNLPGKGNYFWQGTLPTSTTLPTDLMMDDERLFDPFALTSDVTAFGKTQRVQVLGYGLDEALIPIPGVSGQIALEVEAGLTVSYRSQELALRGAAPLLTEDATQPIAPATDAGYGPALEVALQPKGKLRYTAALTFYPAFNIKILGITVGTLDLFTWPIDVFHKDINVVFDPQEARLPLADLELSSDQLTLVPGTTGELEITNRGEAPLVLRPLSLPATLTVTETTIAPGETGVLLLATASDFAGADLVLETNDPDQSQLSITLLASDSAGDADGTDGTDGANDDASAAGGCSSNGNQQLPAAALLLLIALVLGSRRSRTRS